MNAHAFPPARPRKSPRVFVLRDNTPGRYRVNFTNSSGLFFANVATGLTYHEAITAAERMAVPPLIIVDIRERSARRGAQRRAIAMATERSQNEIIAAIWSALGNARAGDAIAALERCVAAILAHVPITERDRILEKLPDRLGVRIRDYDVWRAQHRDKTFTGETKH